MKLLMKTFLFACLPFLLYACGEGELTAEKIAELDTTTLEELKACSNNPENQTFKSECEGRTGIFTALVEKRYHIKREECDDPDWVIALHSSKTEVLADERAEDPNFPRCVRALWRLEKFGLRPLSVLWRESDEEKSSRDARVLEQRQAEQKAEQERQEVERIERAAMALLTPANGFKYEREFLTLDENGYERFTAPVSDLVIDRAKAMATLHVAIQAGKWSFDKDRYVPFSSLRDQYLTYARFLNDKGGQRWPKKSSFETKDQYFARDDMPLEAFNNSVGSLFAEIHGDVKVCRDYYSASSQTLYLSPLKWNKLNGLNSYGDLSEPVKFSVKWTDKMSWGDNSEERSSLYFQPDGWFSIKVSSEAAKRVFSSQECVATRVYGFVRSIRENGNTRQARVIPTKIGFGDELYDVEEY